MAIPVKMPQLGESVTEGTVGKWLKKPGDQVEKYEPLLEVISDKVDTEITATDSGTLLSIEVPEGETVAVGTVLAYIGAEGEQPVRGDGSAEPAPVQEEAPAAVEQVQEAVEEAPQLDATPAETPAAPPVQVPGNVASPESPAPARVTPVVARMLAEHGLDINQIQGTGRDGRVTKKDVEAYLERMRQPAAAPAAPAPAQPRPAEAPAPAPAAPAAPTPAPAPTTAAPRPAPMPTVQPGQIVPLTRMRKAIAEHMVQSKRTAPHVTSVFEADLSAVVAHREAHKAEFAASGLRLTYMPYFVEVVARALQTHRMVNSSFTEDGILIRPDINIGMAAAVEDGQGLIVPVIKHADQLNLRGLARAIGELTDRARSGTLTPDDVSGGTFTITNHGVSGSLWGTPIINPPQAGILGIGKIQKRVVVTPDDAIAIRPMVYLSFTFDHRILDGASADAFMADVVAALESYSG